MVRRDPRFDARIAQAAPALRPILKRLRAAVHAGCPQVEEALKWSQPSFVHHGLLCGMAAFKAHCAFGFWKHDLLVERLDPRGGGPAPTGPFRPPRPRKKAAASRDRAVGPSERR